MPAELDQRAVALIATAVQRDLAQRTRARQAVAARAEFEKSAFAKIRALNESYQRARAFNDAYRQIQSKQSRPPDAATISFPPTSIFDSLRPPYPIPWLEPAEPVVERPDSAAVVSEQIVELPVEAPATVEQSAPPRFAIGVDHDAMRRVTRINAHEIGGARQYRFTARRDVLGRIAVLKGEPATQDTQDAAPQFEIRRDDLGRVRHVEVINGDERRSYVVRRGELGEIASVEKQ